MSAAEGPEDEAVSSQSEAPEAMENLIDQRIHKLQNRRFFLQQMQQVIRRAEDRQHTTGEGHEDDEDVSELDLVEQELDDLLQQKLLNEKRSSSTNGAHAGFSPMAKMETPEGGVYTLPPLMMSPAVFPPPPEETAPPFIPPEEPVPRPATPQPPQPENEEPQEEKEEEEEEDRLKQIEPMETLCKTEAFTRCPSCKKVVFTQIKKFNGDSAWLMCCICSLLGGVVGFCFIPFCLDQVKSVRHKCPECQATIHTYHPF